MKSLDHETVLMQLIKAEKAQREVHSMAYPMRVARFPEHYAVLVGYWARVKPTRSPAWAFKPFVPMARGRVSFIGESEKQGRPTGLAADVRDMVILDEMGQLPPRPPILSGPRSRE